MIGRVNFKRHHYIDRFWIKQVLCSVCLIFHQVKVVSDLTEVSPRRLRATMLTSPLFQLPLFTGTQLVYLFTISRVIIPVRGFITWPTCEEAEGAARPLVQVHVVRVDVTDQDAVVVVIQVVPTEHVQLPPHRRHDVVHSPLQHGTAGQPAVLQEVQRQVGLKKEICWTWRKKGGRGTQRRWKRNGEINI